MSELRLEIENRRECYILWAHNQPDDIGHTKAAPCFADCTVSAQASAVEDATPCLPSHFLRHRVDYQRMWLGRGQGACWGLWAMGAGLQSYVHRTGLRWRGLVANVAPGPASPAKLQCVSLGSLEDAEALHVSATTICHADAYAKLSVTRSV